MQEKQSRVEDVHFSGFASNPFENSGTEKKFKNEVIEKRLNKFSFDSSEVTHKNTTCSAGKYFFDLTHASNCQKYIERGTNVQKSETLIDFENNTNTSSDKTKPPKNKHKNDRFMEKNGQSNIKSCHVYKRRRKYLADLFTTLVEMAWRWHALMFVLVFLVSWLFFALLWFLILNQG